MAIKSNRKDLTLKVFLLTLTGLLILICYVFLQFLVNQEIYPGEILQSDYTETNMFLYGDVRGRLIQLSQSRTQSLSPEDGVYYYYNDGQEIYTNVAEPSIETFRNLGSHFYGSVEGRFYTPASRVPANEFFMNLPAQDYMLTFDDQFIDMMQAKWDKTRHDTAIYVIGITVSFLSAVLLFIRLLYLISNHGQSLLQGFDWIGLEIVISLMVSLVLFLSYIYYNSLVPLFYLDVLTVFGNMALVFASVIGFELLVLMIVSRMKRGQLAETSLVKKLFDALGIMLNSITGNRTRPTAVVSRRTALFMFLLLLLIVLAYFLRSYTEAMLVHTVVTIGLVTWFIRANNKTLSSIEQSMTQSVQEMLKSEKTKMELITNVSHDLKTPLTSVISYVDLLKNEPLGETAAEYVEIIDNKANRLRKILQDVFDLSKATTGAVEVHLEELDLRKLIEQTLLDMDSQVEASGHTIKQSLPDYAVIIRSDGNRLYRVLQNIIDNALKYTHPGTRIFLELTTVAQSARLILKNTSAYAMEDDTDNLLQRFYRADKARTSEGSGLGLSIAESFTQLSGGTFDIELEGDMFKVILTFPIVQTRGIHEGNIH